RLPALAALDAARRFAAGEKRLLGLIGDQTNGSNNWMVAGAHTASGHPLLANDPHLSLYSPPIWWYVHLHTKRAGRNVNRMGAPGVTLGFNDDIAWGATVTNYDVTDIYDETITPGSPDTVAFQGKQVAIQTVNETIAVAGADSVVLPIEIVPHHGYIIPGTKQGGHALSVRYTGFEPSNELAYFLALPTARTVAAARPAQL